MKEAFEEITNNPENHFDPNNQEQVEWITEIAKKREGIFRAKINENFIRIFKNATLHNTDN